MFKLGRKKSHRLKLYSQPRFAKYLETLPALPTSIDYTTKVPNWSMMLNDSLGDCTCAGAGHMVEEFTFNVGDGFTPPDSAILSAYEVVSGYNPNTGANDNGAELIDVLNLWMKTGIAGHKISAFAQLTASNLTEVKQAITLFGAAYSAVELPIAVQDNLTEWNVGPDLDGDWQPGSWGGHCVPIMAFDDNTQLFTIITWGQTLSVSYAFYQRYFDEAYAVLSQDFIEANGQSVSGFDVAILQSDLKELN